MGRAPKLIVAHTTAKYVAAGGSFTLTDSRYVCVYVVVPPHTKFPLTGVPRAKTCPSRGVGGIGSEPPPDIYIIVSDVPE
jgi:hypothetical protein